MEHAEEIKQSLYAASEALSSKNDGIDALQMLRTGKQSMESIQNVFPAADELAQRLESCYIELKDIVNEIDEKGDSIEYNPSRLGEVNERLNVIYSLEKKHHLDTVEQLLDLQHELDKQLNLIDNSDDVLKQLGSQCDAQYKVANELAQQLSEKRKTMAVTLEQRMVSMLQPLGMPNVQFKAEVTENHDLTTTGMDTVTFLFTANKSAVLQPISKVASGGEVARVMLSLKALIAGTVKLPTIIFDEIDTGVSGSIAEKMARIMREMGEQNRQVISITHLPQIAALGSSHYKVYKEDSEDATLSHIVELTPEQRVEEIAHMLSGETLTEAALQNARSLLNFQ